MIESDGGWPRHVGIAGGGAMGSAIAWYAMRAVPVTLVETGREAASEARARIAGLHGDRASEAIAGAVDLTVTANLDELSTCDLVVEAVPERLDLKLEVLRAIADRVAPEAVVGSNTSSLSISAMAEAVAAPSRFLGTHFFNPALSEDLVELVPGAATDPEVVARMRKWLESIGKLPIVVRESPGFVTSRLGVAIALEAMRLLDEGVASAADIDRAMTVGYRHEVGPLRLTDLVGLDVRLAVARELEARLGARFAPPKCLVDLVEAGHFGHKTGQGFYQWEADE